MLKHVSIHDFVLFTEAEIPFAPGLNVLTGETGAGKSLLLDALGLVLGERADISCIREGAESAKVTASFQLPARHPIRALLEEAGIAWEDELMIRRVLQRDGKSKAWVNDVSVTVTLLKQLGALLVERHGQHDQRGLLDASNHVTLLDSYHGNTGAVETLRQCWQQLVQARAVRDALQTDMQQASREAAFLRHMHEELKALSPQPGEESMLADARTNALAQQKTLAAVQEAQALLDGKTPIRQQLLQLEKTLERIAIGEQEKTSMLAGITRAISEIDLVEEMLDHWVRQLPSDVENIDASEERLFALRAAARKYQVHVDDLAALAADAAQKIDRLEHGEEALMRAEKEIQTYLQHYETAAQEMYDIRAKAAEKLGKALGKELKVLKMADTVLSLNQTLLPPSSHGASGMHAVQFLVRTNAGQAPSPLQKVASGGELSRLLLAMKVLMGQHVACAIFDEVDAGTGGAVAEAIGLRLKQLAVKSQVLVVTHLPQVAALSDHHLLITKRKISGRTITDIAPLDEQATREEIARMLSGAEISEEARKTAQKMRDAKVAA